MIYGWSCGLPGVAGCGPGYGLRSRDSRLRSGLLSFVITISWVVGGCLRSILSWFMLVLVVVRMVV